MRIFGGFGGGAAGEIALCRRGSRCQRRCSAWLRAAHESAGGARHVSPRARDLPAAVQAHRIYGADGATRQSGGERRWAAVAAGVRGGRGAVTTSRAGAPAGATRPGLREQTLQTALGEFQIHLKTSCNQLDPRATSETARTLCPQVSAQGVLEEIAAISPADKAAARLGERRTTDLIRHTNRKACKTTHPLTVVWWLCSASGGCGSRRAPLRRTQRIGVRKLARALRAAPGDGF